MLALALTLLSLAPCQSPTAGDLIYACRMVRGERAVLIRTHGGALRRIELETLEPSAEALEHAGSWLRVMEQVDGGRVVTGDRQGRYFLRSAKSLAPLGRLTLTTDRSQCAVDPSGRMVATVGPKGQVHVGRFSEEGGEGTRLELPGGAVRAAFGPRGERLAVLFEDSVEVLSVPEEGPPERLHRAQLAPGHIGTRVAFAGAGLVAVGLHRFEPAASAPFLRVPRPFVHLIEVEDAIAVMEVAHPEEVAHLDGVVSSLKVHPGDDLITFGVSSAGFVVAFDGSSGEPRWNVSFGGGNPGDIGVDHPTGCPLAFTHGMGPAITEWPHGKVRGLRALKGHISADAPPEGDVIVAVRDGALVVLDADTLELKGRRVEPALETVTPR